MSERNRQLLVLGALIAAFVVLLGTRLLGGGGAGSGPRRPTAAGAPVGSAGPVEIAELRLDALDHKPASYKPGRDPFRFAPRRQPKAVAKPEPAAPRPAAKPRPAAPRPRRPPAPKPPAIEFVYLGSFGVPGREIAVFSDGKEILNAFAGDVLQQEFVVRSIGYESADVGFVNFPDVPAERLAVGG